MEKLPKTVIISALGEKTFTLSQIQKLCKVSSVSFISSFHLLSEKEIIQKAKDAEILAITRRSIQDFNKNLIEKLPYLKALAVYSTGYEWIDTQALSENNILLSYLPDYCTQTVAEHTLGMTLTLTRRLHLASLKSSGKISNSVSLRGTELSGKKVGIIGFGKIGQKLADFLSPFKPKIFYYDIQKKYSKKASFMNFHEILKKSDILVLCASKERDSRPIIGKNELEQMKKTSFLVNPSRASLVDHEALLCALLEKKIAGYAVDDTIPLFNQNKELEPGRVFQTGHTAWYSTEAIQRGTAQWVKNIIALASATPIHLVGDQFDRKKNQTH
ncbi:MAG TPA: hypothetical protein DHW82_11305 [Spirochaetia bacterium]|nr:MAG: hypothetical protein A2Y41_11345 [Spirochaetes bacterium GWB1_36_13]HCL57578.1 hypothetical protein [Spirochaetia bacterium]